MEELEIREFISIDTVPRDSYVHLLMEKHFLNKRGYKDIKTKKALEQD